MRRWVIATAALALAAFVAFIVSSVWLYQAPFRELERELAWLKANKVPMTRDELLPPIPEDQNAASLYRKAFAAIRLSEAEEDFLHEQLSPKHKKPVDWQKVQAILDRNRTAIALARQASLLPHLRMTRWAPDFLSTPLPPKIRRLVWLIGREAALKKHNGDVDGAVKNCITIFRMAHHLCDDAPTVIGSLASIASFISGQRALQVALADADASPVLYLSTLDELKGLDFYQIALRGWHGERVGMREFANWIKTAPDEKIIALLRAGSNGHSDTTL